MPAHEQAAAVSPPPHSLRLLFALTYYRPHVSGLTIYVQRLAEALAGRGHQVTVLTSRYDPALPLSETLGGVRVLRVGVLARLSKGVVMPAYLVRALPLLRAADAAIVNLPATPADALGLPLLARLLGRPVLATYHCDVLLPPGAGNRAVTAAVHQTNLAAARAATVLVAYTEDYARASRVLRRFPQKIEVIPPPVALAAPDPADVAAWRHQHGGDGAVLIGFVARLASEKGVEVLLRALPAIRERLGPIRVLFAGEHERVIGETSYRERVRPLLEAAGDAFRLLGVLSPDRLPGFYAACDVTVLPSLNSTESFGLVQVESMLAGTPVVASALPGVRVPILTTGMGRLAPPGDAAALADAIVAVASERERFVRPRAEVASHFSVERTVAGYEALLGRLLGVRA